ncbi:MAG: phosphodiesterase [Lachnospiraceae bacterium]
MKWLIASDIHGSAFYCEKLLQAMEMEQAEKLILLGDLLYHGPRNALPKGYEPSKVAEMLNSIKDKILAVRGNCDSEVDQMVLQFPMMAEYAVATVGGRNFYFSHGHKSDSEFGLPLLPGDALLCGHTHVPEYRLSDGRIYLNPGSVSIPKQDSYHGYILLSEEKILWKDLDGTLKRQEDV